MQEEKGKRCRNWCITLNNYTKEEITQITQYFISKKWLYIIGEEIGEQGTPHLQIYIKCPNAISFDMLKKLNNRLHIEKAKGNEKQNIAYCSKENKYTTNFTIEEPLKDELEGKTLYKYQLAVLNILKEEPHPRKIFWFWERTGNVGKTSLCKHIIDNNKNAIYVSGKANDIKFAIQQMQNKPKIILWDIPRQSLDYISWAGMEEIKNGIFFSGKYESAMVRYNTPHFIVFANEPPQYEGYLSEDRIHAYHIKRV